ncbi:hypothetical protein [Corynebacterium qintianiae]|uniref:hypothetical protein n=1 Tax=Corynebacterium qintianiae TaxID=2709392 RepID=UPI0013EA56E0|nr:hypothetical protein [Corynebacterium qintianiae]
MRSPFLRRASAASIVCTAACLAACAPGGEEPPETTTEATTAVTSAASTQASSSASPTATTSKLAKEEAAVGVVADQFSTLAPKAFFRQLDSCVSVDLEGSYDCSGADVGQFQFFDSEAKAASTTQLLTELRSSRVVEDTGERVVGWSTLGTSAIITVVDNAEGQVMQQLVSSDREDPREKIYSLGLAQRPAEETTEGEAEPTS